METKRCKKSILFTHEKNNINHCVFSFCLICFTGAVENHYTIPNCYFLYNLPAWKAIGHITNRHNKGAVPSRSHTMTMIVQINENFSELVTAYESMTRPPEYQSTDVT